MDKDFILSYVDEINKVLDVYVKVEVEETTLYSGHCIVNRILLLINPNKLARIICKLMNVSFINYEKPNRDILDKGEIISFSRSKRKIF